MEGNDIQLLILRHITLKNMLGVDLIPFVPVRRHNIDIFSLSIDQFKNETEYFGTNSSRLLDGGASLKLAVRSHSQHLVEPVAHFVDQHHVLNQIRIVKS